jgi:2-phospho-L-lactate guanylyltransferase
VKWTAIVPIKAAAERKQRLASSLSPERRLLLSEMLLSAVVATLKASDTIERVMILANEPLQDVEVGWIEDRGRGLNDELTLARRGLPDASLLVVHADLPFLHSDDVAAMAQAGRSGVAIAPDRHSKGTNAVALMPRHTFRFRFGEASFLAHCAQGVPATAVIDTPGLALDIDTPDDIARAVARGFILPG